MENASGTNEMSLEIWSYCIMYRCLWNAVIVYYLLFQDHCCVMYKAYF